ncbi:mavicyanin-like [Primulina huaijiensis]|uniref:mavicyanin-like n=1 Tax=Primulina huaijiensis TaxID=1492673 RepID=UPI003CC711E1
MAKVITSLALLLIFPVAIYCANIYVGDDDSNTGWGWNDLTNYAAWAKDKTFTTKDLLVFQYSGRHSVAEVTETEFNYCDSSNPISLNDSSPTAFPLTTPGTRYFICPTSGHCAEGMKLAITVTDGSSTGTSPPSGTTPSPPSRTRQSPPDSGTTPSSPDSGTIPNPSGSTVVLPGRNSLLIAVATLFGVIG